MKKIVPLKPIPLELLFEFGKRFAKRARRQIERAEREITLAREELSMRTK